MILVTGATGSVGRHVVDGLLKESVRVRAVTRDPARAALPAAVEVVAGDLDHPGELPLDGITAAYVIAMGERPGDVASALAAAGVGKAVLLSTAEVHDGPGPQLGAIAVRHAAFEQAIASSGLRWTFLRPTEFAGNALHWAGQIRAGDVVAAPYGEACTAPVHERDVAAVAVRALLSDGLDCARLVLTGPEALTHREQVRRIGAALGRPLRFEEVPAAVVRAKMAEYAPAEIVDAVLDRLAETVGVPAQATGAVLEVTGRRPLSFDAWIAEHQAAFR